MTRAGRAPLAATAALALALAGCTVRIASDLDEEGAGRVVRTLSAEGVAADRSPEPGAPGRYGVEVAEGDTARAVAVLTSAGLPRQASKGVLEALGGSSLVPSRTSEHARWLQGLAGELEQTLSEVDGVVAVRVHLSAERRDPVTGDQPSAPAASVLLKRRAGAPTLPDDDIRRLVQGAVSGLTAERVSVVQTEARGVAPSAELVRVGPFTTPRHLASRLRAALAAAALLNVALVAGLAALFWKGRTRAAEGK